MKKSTFAFASLVITAFAAVAGVSVVALQHSDEQPRFQAAWKDVFDRPDSMVRSVDLIVVARHLGTSPGRVAFSSDPADAVPFELNHFVVERGMKGVRPGSSITVERLGGDRDGESIVLDADGGPYEAGSLYVLFLNKQDESSNYYLVNDEGRYAVDSSDRLIPAAADGAVAAALRGQTVADLASLVGRVISGR